MIEVVTKRAGRAIVYRSGRYVGRVVRVGTAWQAWSPTSGDVDRFRGWGARRCEAVAVLVPQSKTQERN